ncbi:hypothetical protein [Hufsiella arboris]|uniref:hypothetical protein n=1 Tax=Hufsiella arboris TaxID=2695275 RepID=UPI0019294E53|nr:hypothetical protein [Hufsiella arboris]
MVFLEARYSVAIKPARLLQYKNYLHMVEVFKTNVKRRSDANRILFELHQIFRGYQANFDLEDCDNILRVQNVAIVEPAGIILLLQAYGFHCEILADIVPGHNSSMFYSFNVLNKGVYYV